MDTLQHEAWVKATLQFWDAGSEFEAKYRRICSSAELDATTNEDECRELWEAETEAAMPHLLSGIPIQRNWTCLEIGCGVGRLLKPIAQRCETAIGIDISANMIEWSKSYLKDVPNAETRLGNGCNLPGVADASVDFVYSHLMFQHLTRFDIVDAYLREIRRVLKPGGYCRIQNWRDAHKPFTESLKDLVRPILGRARYKSSRCWVWEEGKAVRFGGVVFHPRQWRKRLRRHGLMPESVEVGLGHDFWMWVTCRPNATR